MPKLLTIQEALAYFTKQLQKCDPRPPSSQMEARMIIQNALSITKEDIFKRSNELISQSALNKISHDIEKRKKLIPISYIIGEKEFYSLNFIVSKDTLIPRQDSEVLVSEVIKDYSNDENNKLSLGQEKKILDLGTGSGCLLIAILKNLKPQTYKGVAADISKKTLEIAKLNSINHNLENKIEFIQSNWFEKIPTQQFDIIISNPPYISQNETSYTSPELKYEPQNALFASENGLEHYIKIAKSCRNYCHQTTKIYIEIGFMQDIQVSNIFALERFKLLKVCKDIQKHPRILVFQAPQTNYIHDKDRIDSGSVMSSG